MSVDLYQKEKDELGKYFIDRFYINNWKNASRDNGIVKYPNSNYTMLELIISKSCNLKCSYCYYTNYRNELNPVPEDKHTILTNFEKVIKYVSNNQLILNLDLFSGEFFVLPYCFDILNIIYTYQKNVPFDRRIELISIPTNGSFIYSEEKTNKVKEYMKKFYELGIPVSLSFSIDGPFLDYINRPHYSNSKEKYNKNFYKNIIKFAKKFHIGAHPMIYSDGVEQFLDTFIWFDTNFEGLYLLEVRNSRWSKESLLSLYYTLKSILSYILYKSNNTIKDFIKRKKDLNNFYNIFMSPFMQIGRGIGCSIQSSLAIRLSDMAVVPCHRTSYPENVTGYINFTDSKDYEFLSKNIELYIQVNSSTTRNFIPCEVCPIRYICSGPCLGGNYEHTGDMFVTDPNVCLLEFTKLSAILSFFNERNILPRFLKDIEENKKSSIHYILTNWVKIFEGESYGK